jgi:hypothetical protein
MIPWEARSLEERSLLNPCFCAMLLWHAAVAYREETGRLMSLEESFLVLPIILHRETRDALPRSTRTSLAVWIQENPLTRGRIGARSQALVPYTREALLFAGLRALLQFQLGTIEPDTGQQQAVAQVLRNATDEVKDCAKRASFVGRWFGRTGGPTTVLALLGVRP